uniref:Uncharacterized protein n=1 Tax=Oryza punctata TaxID=4537 RepID=A0A0E0JHZ6_ORYPU
MDARKTPKDMVPKTIVDNTWTQDLNLSTSASITVELLDQLITILIAVQNINSTSRKKTRSNGSSHPTKNTRLDQPTWHI